MRYWLANLRNAFHLLVEHPLVSLFGTTEPCGCQHFRGKLRFVCANHFLQATKRGPREEI